MTVTQITEQMRANYQTNLAHHEAFEKKLLNAPEFKERVFMTYSEALSLTKELMEKPELKGYFKSFNKIYEVKLGTPEIVPAVISIAVSKATRTIQFLCIDGWDVEKEKFSILEYDVEAKTIIKSLDKEKLEFSRRGFYYKTTKSDGSSIFGFFASDYENWTIAELWKKSTFQLSQEQAARCFIGIDNGCEPAMCNTRIIQANFKNNLSEDVNTEKYMKKALKGSNVNSLTTCLMDPVDLIMQTIEV